VYRLLALLLAFAAAACGGGGSSDDPTATNAPASPTAANQVAGARTQTPGTPNATPTPPGTYEVVDGDTLSAIAERFGTTVEALVAANGLASADELQIGQVLKISAAAPSTGTTTSTPGANSTSSATATQ
jgi:LysM repeat protein